MYTIDLQPFKDFMGARNLVPEKYRTYYVNWVRKFLQSEFNAQELTAKDKITCYLDQMSRSEKIQDWQLKQAEQAVKLYMQVFLPEENRERPSLDSAHGAEKAARLDVAAVTAMREMRKLLRLRHYAYRTEKTYMEWVERYLDYALKQGLEWKASGSVRSFLSHLALQKPVASSTQNQALNALIFFFRETLHIELEKIDAVRAKRGRRLPTVLSVEEVKRLLDQVKGPKGLMLRLTYGGGLRVSETIRLRIQDLDFENSLLFIRSGKGVSRTAEQGISNIEGFLRSLHSFAAKESWDIADIQWPSARLIAMHSQSSAVNNIRVYLRPFTVSSDCGMWNVGGDGLNIELPNCS